MTETCTTCRYAAPIEYEAQERLRCAARPPVVAVSAKGYQTVWPHVRDTDWCGWWEMP